MIEWETKIHAKTEFIYEMIWNSNPACDIIIMEMKCETILKINYFAEIGSDTFSHQTNS